MKKLILTPPGGIDSLRQVEARDPVLGPDDVLVRVRANSLNYHDLYVARALVPPADGRVPMSDAAGLVEAVGANVTEFVPGDHVISAFFPATDSSEDLPADFSQVPGDGVDGFAAERVACPANALTRAPVGFSFSEAATLPCAALTAWRALVVNGNVQKDQTVLIQGSGGVSIFALQFAKALGAKVVAISSSDEKLDRLRAIGADEVINYRSTPQWGDVVRKLTGGVHHVIEVGGAGTLPQSIAAARNSGHIAIIGVLAGFVGEVPIAAVMRKQLKLIGLTVGSRTQQQQMVEAIETLQFRPILDRDFDLSDTAAAFRHQESGHHFGKITVTV